MIESHPEYLRGLEDGLRMIREDRERSSDPRTPRQRRVFPAKSDNRNVTKDHLVGATARTSSFSLPTVRMIVEAFLEVIPETIARGDVVELRGFATFYPKTRKARPARNPRTGEVVPLPSRIVALARMSPDIETVGPRPRATTT